MSEIATLLHHPAVLRLSLVLLHFLWQGAALAALALAALLALRRAKPAARYLALLVVLAAMVAAPVATFLVLPGIAAPVSVAPPAAEPARGHSPAPPAIDLSASTAAHLPAPAGSSPAGPAPRLAQAWQWLDARLAWVAAGWAVGVILLSLRLLLGWIGVARVRRRKAQPAAERWQTAMAALAQRLRVARPVRLLESAAAQVPTVIGWLRPVILLPASALIGLTSQQVEALIAHELAHIRRGDYLVNLLQTVVETLLFYHPAVWWVSHRIRVEREHCCDDLAVSCCGDPLAYARALTEMEHLRSAAPRPALAAGGGSLPGRVYRLLGAAPAPCRHRASWLAGALALAAVAALGLSIAAGGCKRKPPTPAESAAAKTAAAKAALDDALAAARAIDDDRKRAYALNSLVWSLHPVDPDQALDIARTIELPRPRADALANIARGLAATDPVRSRQIGIEGLQAAREIEDEHQRDWVLRDLAQTLAKVDTGKALETARAIASASMRVQSLAVVAYEVADASPEESSALFDEALELARTKEGSGGLGDVAARLAAVDPERALDLAMTIESSYYRTWRVEQVLRTVADRDLDEALTLADMVGEQTVRDRALQRIAVGLAEENPEKALAIARTMRVHTDFAYVTAVVSRVLARTDKQRSHALALEALEEARKVTTPRARAIALRMVALALSRTDVDEALEVALSIDCEAAPANRYWHTRALLSVISMLAKTDPDRALETVQHMKYPGQSVEAYEEARVGAMLTIAQAVRKTDPSRADEILRDAEAAAKKISPGHHRDSALSRVRGAAGKATPAKAPKAARHALDEAKQIEDTGRRDEALMRLCGDLARTDPDLAREAAAAVEDDWSRAVALTGIASVLLDEAKKAPNL